MVTRLGTELGTLLGSDIGTFVDNPFVLRGLVGFTDADYYAAATVEGATYASAGWFGSVTFVVPSQAIASQTRDLIGTYASGAGGFLVRFSGTASTVNLLGALTNGGIANGAVHTIAAADVGKLCTLTWTWDSSALRFRSVYKRVESAGTAGAFPYAPSAGTLYYGREILTGRSAGGIQTFGLQLGRGTLTAAEMIAHQDAVVAQSGQMVAMPGKTIDLLVNTTQDIAGGSSSPAALANRAGAGSLTRTGNPSVIARTTAVFA